MLILLRSVSVAWRRETDAALQALRMGPRESSLLQDVRVMGQGLSEAEMRPVIERRMQRANRDEERRLRQLLDAL